MTVPELLAYLETRELFTTIPGPAAREAALLVRRLGTIAKVMPHQQLPRLPTISGR